MSDEKRKPKAIAMISGGLDSTLAVEQVKRMGFEVKAINFYTGFCITETHRRNGGRAKDGKYPVNEPLQAAAWAQTDIDFIDVADEYVQVVTNPKYGYGKNMNPCIDCRIFMMKKAKEVMEKEGAEFVFTGEVLGQRPKSQRRDALRIIERDSGLTGKLLRPLSGRHLPPVDAEKEGLISRDDLLGISGRGRKPQIALAEEYGLDEYPQPAGGCCFLTDEAYAGKFRDLIEHREGKRYTKDDVILLAVGRHFRLAGAEKLIVSRTDGENAMLERYTDGRWRVVAKSVKGPLALLEGDPSDDVRRFASQIVARYGKGKAQEEVTVEWTRDGEMVEVLAPRLGDVSALEEWRL